MGNDQLIQKIEAMQLRLAAMVRPARESAEPDASVLDVEMELSSALEELQVASEELQRQNEELERRIQEQVGELRQANEVLRAEAAEHERTAKSLLESEDRYRSLVEFAPETIAVHRGGRWIYINPAGLRLLGASDPSEIVGRPVLDFVHPDVRAAVKERIQQLERGDQRLTSPRATRLVRLDGQMIYGEAMGISTSFQGQPAVLVVIRDITERMHAEKRTSWLASFPELNPNPVIEVDVAGHVHYANPAALRAAPDLREPACQHPWLAGLQSVFDTLRSEGHEAFSREVRVGDAWHHQSLFVVPGTQLLRGYTFDVSERKRAEEELRRANERVCDVLGSITDAYFCLDAAWRFLEINSVAEERIFRRPFSELLGKVFWEEYPQAVGTESYRQYHQAVTEQRPVHFEAPSRLVPGGWLEEHVYPREGRLEIYARDIAHRKQAEELLKRYQLLAERARDIVLFVRRDGRILEANQSAVAAYGFPREELLALNIQDLRAPDTRALTVQQMAQADIEGILFETVHLRKDGTPFPVEVSSRGTTLGGERVLLSIIRDITERKRNEAALREGEERLRMALRAANAGSWEWDLITGKVKWSDEHYALLGMEAGVIEVSYDSWMQALHPDDREIAEGLIRRATNRKENVDIEYRVIRPDGNVRWLNTRGHSLYDEAGRPIRMLGITIDVTQRRQAEEALRSARETLEGQFLHRTAELTRASQRLQVELTRHEEAEEEIQRLGQTLKHRASELVALDRVGRALTSSLDPEAVLWLLLSEVKSLLGTEGAAVLQHEPESDELVFVASEGVGLEGLMGQRVPTRDSIVGWVFHQRRATLVDDVRKDPRFFGRVFGVSEIPFRSMVAVPLISRGAVLGVLGTINKIDGAFSEDDLQILTAIANAAAVAIENARLYAAEQGRRRQLEAVRAVTGEITRELELSKVLGLIVRRAIELIGVGTGTVWLWDEGEQALISRARLHPGEDWIAGRKLRLGEGTAGMVVERKQGLIVNEYQTWPHALPYLVERGTITATMGEPLMYGDRCLGALVVNNDGTGRKFSQEDGQLLALLASQAAIAIENARLFEEVRVARERLENLSRKLVEIQEAERRHIARELHDEIGQSLTGLKLLLDMNARVSPEQARENQSDAQTVVNDLLSQVRDLSLELRPAMLDDLGLLPSLVWYFERYRTRTNVQVNFKHVGMEGRRFPIEAETAIYRIVQEALTNVARHARVNEVTIRLWAGEETLGVQIEDRGVGFDPEVAMAAHISSGLAGMRERAGLLGGRMTIESAPGSGSCIAVEFPIGGGIGKVKTGSER
ncbi:MAG TPA: PAS domain S-box protein [Candidatus Methylomirabilis sp.]|nr:PAS domain S-box protein [Candidatus Methylomirabilis sp.]